MKTRALRVFAYFPVDNFCVLDNLLINKGKKFMNEFAGVCGCLRTSICNSLFLLNKKKSRFAGVGGHFSPYPSVGGRTLGPPSRSGRGSGPHRRIC